MNKYGSLILAAVLALLAAGALALRITLQTQHFDKTVRDALKTSEGYDEKFINMVNRLERELALRASFGYIGGKDPMTGKERIVVKAQSRQKRKGQASEKSGQLVSQEVDSVKLTAIIYDDTKKLHTAIIMVGERSFAIETGDYVVGRKVSRINDSLVVMEDGGAMYIYDIAGNMDKRQK